MSDELIYLLENADNYQSFVENQIEKHIETNYNNNVDSFVYRVKIEGPCCYLLHYSNINGVSPIALRWWVINNCKKTFKMNLIPVKNQIEILTQVSREKQS